ncbi:hypothetical protein EVAR_10359_1 [Eumeta japonica]|uniref:Uncharacterized protein n=1 Tax=Eumeta variegata TaxID=151549 RepID=A0A4C1THG7_EUMVA|nr:hypothetical protein EVAR_10359_1 [Eumeta japonica]
MPLTCLFSVKHISPTKEGLWNAMEATLSSGKVPYPPNQDAQEKSCVRVGNEEKDRKRGVKMLGRTIPKLKEKLNSVV